MAAQAVNARSLVSSGEELSLCDGGQENRLDVGRLSSTTPGGTRLVRQVEQKTLSRQAGGVFSMSTRRRFVGVQRLGTMPGCALCYVFAIASKHNYLPSSVCSAWGGNGHLTGPRSTE